MLSARKHVYTFNKLNQKTILFRAKSNNIFCSVFPIVAPTNDNIFVHAKVYIQWQQIDNKLNKFQIEHKIKTNVATTVYDKFAYFDFYSIFSKSNYISDSLHRDLDTQMHNVCLILYTDVIQMKPACCKVRLAIIDYRNISSNSNNYTYNQIKDSYNSLIIKCKQLSCFDT